MQVVIDRGVVCTPTFFINGGRYENSWDFHTLSRILKKSLPHNP
jgi:protein-disulfide isomerase